MIRFLNPILFTARLFTDQDGNLIENLKLESADGTNYWKKAWEKQLSEQNIFNQIVGWPIKAALRMWGWFTIDMLVYGPKTLFGRFYG